MLTGGIYTAFWGGTKTNWYKTEGWLEKQGPAEHQSLQWWRGNTNDLDRAREPSQKAS